jgi:hypothetical protein
VNAERSKAIDRIRDVTPDEALAGFKKQLDTLSRELSATNELVRAMHRRLQELERAADRKAVGA